MKRTLSFILVFLMTLSFCINLISCTTESEKSDGDGEGVQWQTGADGLTPYIGSNGNWWIGDNDTGVRAEGVDGKDGKDGITPTVEISEDGFWVINGVKTGFRAVCDHIAFASSLDDIAWEEFSYRDIFIENNKAYVDGFNKKSFAPYVRSAGNNTVSGDEYYSYPYSLNATGDSSQRIVSPSPIGESGNYFVASKIYCVRYEKGMLGIRIDNVTVGVSRATYDFVTQADIVYADSEEKIYIGSFSSAELDGYIDDPVVVDMSVFTVLPTLEQMTALYENYVKLERAVARDEIFNSEDDMLKAFMEYMEKKAESIGMTDSEFNDPVGADNSCTAYDLARLMIYADANYPELENIWGSANRDISVTGPKARSMMLRSSVIKSDLEDHYHIVAGKTGTIGRAINLAVILEIPNSSDRLAVVILYADGANSQKNNRFAAAKQAADAAILKYNDPTYDNSRIDVCCECAVVCLIPEEGADMKALKVLYAKNEKELKSPASVTKVLTVICALDFIDDLKEKVAFSTFDIENCFWYYKDFFEGDVLSFEDLLYSVFLPSSNPAAVAVARIGGKALLEMKN